MRAIWKGAVSFGLVSIAVKLYSATEEKDIRFHQVHRADGGRIRYRRVCESCGNEVGYDDIARGFDLGGGEMVILTDEDFADLPLATSRAIDVLEFVPAEQVDPILYNRAYYLEPEPVATKPYVLLRDALTESDRVAIVKVALRQREQLATLRVREGVMVLNTMLWPDEIRQATFDFLGQDITVRPQELAMASSLIESMAGDFKPGEFTDEYRVALQAVIDAKVRGEEIVTPAEVERAPTGAVDLMAALRASVERARAAREAGGQGTRAGEREREPVEPTPITAAKSAQKAAKPEPRPADRSDGERRPARPSAKPARTEPATGRRAPAKKSSAGAPAGQQADPTPRKATKRQTGATSKSRRSA